MDWLALLLKLVHVLLAMGMVTGAIGRVVVLRRAAVEERVERTAELTELAAPFERMVIGSSIAILPAGMATAAAMGYPWLGLTTGWMLASTVIYLLLTALVPTIFIPRGHRFEAALADARRAGRVTPRLRDAFSDPAVAFARNAELVGLAVIIGLMVVKPF